MIAAWAMIFSGGEKLEVFGIKFESLNRHAAIGICGLLIYASIGVALAYGHVKTVMLNLRVPFGLIRDQIAIGALSILNGRIIYNWKSEIDQEFNRQTDRVVYEIDAILQVNIAILLLSSLIFQAEIYRINERAMPASDYIFAAGTSMGLLWLWFMFRWMVREAGECAYKLAVFARSEKKDGK